jgi:hypothetical protein
VPQPACRCRFVAPGKPAPDFTNVTFSKEPYSLIYNGTCMREVNEALLARITPPAVNLTRPAPADLNGSPGNAPTLLQSLAATFRFFQLQWAGGNVPKGLFPEWRETGFTNLDQKSCNPPGGSGGTFGTYDTSFANGSASSCRINEAACAAG